MAVLSHVLLFITSLFASPLGEAGSPDVAMCQSVPSRAQVEHIERAWAHESHPGSVRVFGPFRTHDATDATPLRVLSRCIVKPAPEHQQPVLFGAFGLQVDDPDDENLASSWTEAKAQLPRRSGVGARPTAMYVLRAPRTQLERPPRV